MNTKHLSFLFPIPDWHFSAAVKIVTPYVINVRYTLHWNKKVDVEAYYIKPGMAQHIINWTKLEQEIQDAAENNSKQYRLPGDYRGGHVRPEGVNAYEDIHDQWKQEVGEKRKE
jgi:hypothetical protein